ncbi:sugar transferase [Lactiplantibacillus sp. WILCCON 0030]|uniref:Sugar transferase n=1 Tax=Lactiplantibacillus brownii TaxID=3069269 RepID=A0ABU1A8J5_9LACO|nr:sugar transferase [Lactiplantibacillus brownii]MDQ7936960.1 sugar transferase [Lactiplantibacillus brownii]
MYANVKRFFDIIVSILALVCFSPFFLIVFVLDLFGDNRGPLLYAQVRVGKNHKKFKILKFRSMIVDADKKLAADPELFAKYVANNYKLPSGEDPRVTKLGAFLRKTSLDEIPQFLNILSGEMTLIGPRPVVEPELKEYGNEVDLLLSVKPGAMGYWQANGRSNIGYPERCNLELYYVKNASLGFDLRILFKNIYSIFRSEGAF